MGFLPWLAYLVRTASLIGGRDGSPDVKVQHEQVAATARVSCTSFRTLFCHGFANSRLMRLGVGVHKLGSLRSGA